jgi:hypothetical protein
MFVVLEERSFIVLPYGKVLADLQDCLVKKHSDLHDDGLSFYLVNTESVRPMDVAIG